MKKYFCPHKLPSVSKVCGNFMPRKIIIMEDANRQTVSHEINVPPNFSFNNFYDHGKSHRNHGCQF